MSNSRCPGPQCQATRPVKIHEGILTRTTTAHRGPLGLPAHSTFEVFQKTVDLYSTPRPGEVRPIVVLEAALMAKPQFLGHRVVRLRRGHRVKVIKLDVSWCFVEFKGRRGWIHRNRITRKTIRLRSHDTGPNQPFDRGHGGGRG
jgi:hypothetical protein